MALKNSVLFYTINVGFGSVRAKFGKLFTRTQEDLANFFRRNSQIHYDSIPQEMKSKIYKRWDSILGDLLAICNTEITTKFEKIEKM